VGMATHSPDTRAVIIPARAESISAS